MGTLIVALNLPKVLAAFDTPDWALWAARAAVLAVGAALSWRGVRKARAAKKAEAGAPVPVEKPAAPATVHAA